MIPSPDSPGRPGYCRSALLYLKTRINSTIATIV
jgi:hypothetical protein